MPDKDKVLTEDPFNLYDILNKRKDSGDDLKYPHGFTSSVINVEGVNEKVKEATSNEVNEHVNSTLNKLEESVPKGKLSLNNSVYLKRVHTGGSILELIDELVKDHGLEKKHIRKLKIALDLLSEKGQGVTITDCHAGNPCVHICDPTAKTNDPIIEGIQGM
ncbi:hypothetical protein Tco_1207102 [Tanacetum coccineum]